MLYTWTKLVIYNKNDEDKSCNFTPKTSEVGYID